MHSRWAALAALSLSLSSFTFVKRASANEYTETCLLTSHNDEEAIEGLKSLAASGAPTPTVNGTQFNGSDVRFDTCKLGKTKLIEKFVQWVNDNNCGTLYYIAHTFAADISIPCRLKTERQTTSVPRDQFTAAVTADPRINVHLITCNCVPPDPRPPNLKFCPGRFTFAHPAALGGKTGFISYSYAGTSESQTRADGIALNDRFTALSAARTPFDKVLERVGESDASLTKPGVRDAVVPITFWSWDTQTGGWVGTTSSTPVKL